MTEEKQKPTLYLIDGSNYVYRAFYAIRQLSNSKGFPTNAIYGFINMISKLFRERRPDYVVVVFDAKGPTFRSEAYEQYKAHRPAMPDALVPQIPYIKEVVRAFSIPLLEKEGLEADDIIGSIARHCESEGVNTVIVSGDKDLMQLVTDNIVMYDTMKDKTYDVQGVRERFGVSPGQVADILGLMGDTSDNIPGVPGVGEKTARSLIAEYGSIEGVLENIPKVKNARIRESLEKNADLARLSRDLAVLRTELEVDFRLEDARFGEPDKEKLRDLYKEFEFSSLIQELAIRPEARQTDYAVVDSEKGLSAVVKELSGHTAIALCLELDASAPMLAEITGISLSAEEGKAWYIPTGHEEPGSLDTQFVLAQLSDILADEKILKHGHDLKNILIVLARKGIALRGIGCDTKVGSYILNPSKRSHDLPEIARDFLNTELAPIAELTGSGAKKQPLAAFSPVRAMAYSCPGADAVLRLASVLGRKIGEGDMERLYREIEMPLIEVLAAMEQRGVLIDRVQLDDMSKEFESLLAQSEEKIYRLAGEEFNINSPKQLQYILFEKLGLSKGRKTKNGYSTDVDVLMALAPTYELPAEILSYRSMSKLKSTYVDALPNMINPDTGRIHTSYNQTVTATGRLSSSDPNLQNIPIRGTEGKRIRQAFVAPEGCEIVSADYSQIELRILAHLSGDEILIEFFRSGEDIHARTAAEVFGVLPGTVTSEMRRQAKVINFGIIYGMSPFGLAKELGISQNQAKTFIDRYFQEFRKVREYLDGILNQARSDGFVTTLFNRRRYLPEINSPNFAVRQFAERTAVNTPIQGTAADLIKAAMVSLHRKLGEGKLQTGMIMQVHDELVFEVPSAEKQKAADLIRREMEEVIELKVPLVVEVAAGKNWDEAH